MADQLYNWANIRELLTQGFNDQELRALCFDVSYFQPVYDQLALNTSKDEIVAKLLEHAKKQLLVDTLLAVVKDRNPKRFEEHKPYYVSKPSEAQQKQGVELTRVLPSMPEQSNQYYSCFISYSHKDEAFAERLHADLQQVGVQCWFAPKDLKIGERIRVGIDQSIRGHDKLLLILSEHSMASDWVEQEVETAFEQERKRGETMLFPIRLDEVVMKLEVGWAAHIKRTRHIGDFREWEGHASYQKAFQRLLKDLSV